MRIDLLEAFGLDPNVIAILKQKYGAQLLPIQERAFKEHQILNGVTEKGLALSNIRLRGLGRTYINCLIIEGYDTPEAVAELPLTELERLLPKHLAERLYRHFHKDYQKQEDATDQKATAGIREASDPTKTDTEAAPPAISPLDGAKPFPKALADILQDKTLLATLRARLADAKDLRELIADPPVIFMDERQQLFFYRGIPLAALQGDPPVAALAAPGQ